MSGEISTFSNADIMKCITNITEWLHSSSHTRPLGKLKEVCAEDLAIGIPGECLFPELMAENEEASREDEKGILVFTDHKDEKYIWLRDDWHHLEDILSFSTPKTGWQRANFLWERLLVLILTQLDYTAKESLAEVPYGCCPLSDPAYLLWCNNKPIGMCSLKRKGSSIWGGEDVYACDSLDTLYIRAPYRRRGHAISLLYMLTSQLSPGDHLGLSHPVSISMCKVLLKFIQIYPSLRETIWTLDEDGEVCGTVLLMLGSLMVRGVLQPPASLVASSQPSSNKIEVTQTNTTPTFSSSQSSTPDTASNNQNVPDSSNEDAKMDETRST